MKKQFKPKVLVVTTSTWYPTARLCAALAKAGCVVEALCPPHHPLNKTRNVSRVFRYRGLAPLGSFSRAIASSQADLIIPADDLATQHLHRLYERARKEGSRGAAICALIEKSCGSPESFPLEYARTTFIEAAEREGVRVPRTNVVADVAALRQSIARLGLPLVLKVNGSSGGYGVRIVHTADEAESAFRQLSAPPRWMRAAKRAVMDRDASLLVPALVRRPSVVNAQTFVAGREATTALACWQGTILAALHFEVVEKRNASGPATVLRLIENAEMSATAEKLVSRLNLSGLHGFDYMLETLTGHAYLIEMNPRATQVGHLSLGAGRDIPAAIFAALCSSPVQAAPKVTELNTIALFPQEWIRDPGSAYLKTAYHDIPWDEPELVQDCVHSFRKQRSWYTGRKVSQESNATAGSEALGMDWEVKTSHYD